MANLKTMKSKELKSIAKGMGIKGWWDMNKAQLIEAIENHCQTEELIIDDPVEEVVKNVPEEVVTKEDVNTLSEEENATENVQDKPEQQHKKNQKRLIEYKGKTQTLTAWAKELGIRHQTLYNRIVMKGMDPVEAFEKPLKKGASKDAS